MQNRVDSDTTSQIHPINTQYLLSSEPHRLYGDRGGNLLEVAVERLSHTVIATLYSHGGIIAVGYHDATTDGQLSFETSYILQTDGRILPFQSSFGRRPPLIDIDMIYMLLNPVDINGWMLVDREKVQKEIERKSFGRFGLGVSLQGTQGATDIKGFIALTRERYFHTLK